MRNPAEDTLATQLAELRERLLHDAVAVGMPQPMVLTTIEEVAATYVDARVTSFVAVLVEREVRARLHLPLHMPDGTD